MNQEEKNNKYNEWKFSSQLFLSLKYPDRPNIFSSAAPSLSTPFAPLRRNSVENWRRPSRRRSRYLSWQTRYSKMFWKCLKMYLSCILKDIIFKKVSGICPGIQDIQNIPFYRQGFILANKIWRGRVIFLTISDPRWDQPISDISIFLCL